MQRRDGMDIYPVDVVLGAGRGPGEEEDLAVPRNHGETFLLLRDNRFAQIDWLSPTAVRPAAANVEITVVVEAACAVRGE